MTRATQIIRPEFAPVPNTRPQARAQRDGICDRWLQTVSGQLHRFARTFSGPVHELTAPAHAPLPMAVRKHLAKSPRTGEYITIIRRNIEDSVRSAMADTPVVLLNGARQTGKTTLAQAMATAPGVQYFTLDDAATLALAAGDPSGFIHPFPHGRRFGS
jgi:hypothetical protein